MPSIATHSPIPTTPRRLIITGGDARYFPILQELIASIRRFPALSQITIGCIDGGLTDAQRDSLQQQNILVRAPRLFSNVSQRALRKRPNLAIELSKMWLNELFPEFDTLAWIDADAWVQNHNAVELLFNAAEQEQPSLAIVPELFLHKPFRLRWTPLPLAQVRSILYKNARLARLPRKICRSIGVRPTLNGGVFSLSRSAPHWARLQQWQTIVLKHGKIFSSGQLSLALTSYHDRFKTSFLPSSCNYLGPWLIDTQTNQLCEATFPHKPVGIVHLAGYDAMRLDHTVTTDVLGLDGETYAHNLRFSCMQPLQKTP